MRVLSRAAVLASVVALTLTGCRSLPPVVPVEPSPPEVRLAALAAVDARVAGVGHRLSIANAELCPRTAMLAGWALHAASQYGTDLRSLAETRFGLSGNLPGVLAVVEGGPAARAGLLSGDLILAVDGRALDVGQGGAVAFYEGFAANVVVLDEALSDGAALLTVRRGEMTLDLALRPERGCAYRYQVDSSPDLYARASSDTVFISMGMADYAASDDDLAVLLGHELAHAVLEHSEQSGGLNNLPWRVDDREREADRVGLYLMARAGYDPAKASDFWLRFAVDYWDARYLTWGHPSARERARELADTVTEIERQKAAGAPIRF